MLHSFYPCCESFPNITVAIGYECNDDVVAIGEEGSIVFSRACADDLKSVGKVVLVLKNIHKVLETLVSWRRYIHTSERDAGNLKRKWDII